MCKEIGAYPDCECPDFVQPDSTPGVVTWEELLEHMDNLVAWSVDLIKSWKGRASQIQVKAGSSMNATMLGECYCGCCTVKPDTEKACTAPIGANEQFKHPPCRAVFCTKEADQSLQWNNDQWNSFCSNSCFATTPGDKFDKSCRAVVIEDTGVKSYKN